MSNEALIKAEVTAYKLASDAARLACSLVRIGASGAPVYADSARYDIQAMRAALNEIEGILETEAENSGDRNKNRKNGNV